MAGVLTRVRALTRKVHPGATVRLSVLPWRAALAARHRRRMPSAVLVIASATTMNPTTMSFHVAAMASAPRL